MAVLGSTSWPADGLEAVRRCPACGSENRKTRYENLRDQVFFCAPGAWTLFGCRDCGTAYLDPRPTADTVHLAYRRYYTHKTPKRKATADLPWTKRQARALANGYRNWRFGGEQAPALGLGRFLVPLLPAQRRSMDFKLRHLPRVWPGANLLDVGFGSAAFLERARRVGWSVAGVDPDPESVARARRRGLEVTEGGVDALAGQSERFDAITMSHVIEHLHEPREALDQAFRLLRPGGRLYLETPNVEALSHAQFGEHWRGLEVPRHLAIFSWKAVEDMLDAAGFATRLRLLRTDVYPTLAAASRAMQRGRDPYRDKVGKPADRFRNLLFAFAARANPRRSEFIAFVAYRPA